MKNRSPAKSPKTTSKQLSIGLLGSSAVADTTGGRQDASLPTQIEQVLGLDDDSALVLGRSSPELLRIGVDGRVGSLQHPSAGPLLHVAARGSELWIVGTQAVLRRGQDGSWGRLPLSVEQIDPGARLTVNGWRGAQALVLAADRVAVIRTVEDGAGLAGAEILVVDAAMNIQRQLALPGVVFSSAVPDGSDGLWAVAYMVSSDKSKSDSLLGYAHFAAGRWTLWRIPYGEGEVPESGFERERRVVTSSFEVKWAVVPALLESLAADGLGGAYGFWGGALFHVDRDGEIKKLGTTSEGPRKSSYFDHAIAVDPSSGNIVILATPFGEETSVRVTRIGADGTIVHEEQVPLPSWFTSAQFKPPLLRSTLSFGPRSMWISAGPFVFATKAAAELATYSSPEVQQKVVADAWAAKRADVREGILKSSSLILSALLLLGAGAFGGSRINDERFLFTGGQALGGAALSLLPALALDAFSPGRGWGMGMAGAQSSMFFSAGAVAAPLLGALGTWGTGELLHASRSPGAAFGGAVAGAAVGTLLSIGVTLLLKDLPSEFQPTTLGLTLGLIGAGATVGYQALGGGPRR